MGTLTDALIKLHGEEGLRAEQWFDLMIDDVLAGFGLRLTDIPSEAVRAVLFDLSGLYARSVIDAEPFSDILGVVHMDLVSRYHQKGSGQFFTPATVGRMMAMMAIGDLELPTDRLTRIGDPAVGAGGLLLCAAGQILDVQGPDGLALVSLTGIDIDYRCARMYPCQLLSSLHVHQLQLGELVAYHGNALGDTVDWRTVCHYSRSDLPFPVAPADHPQVKQAIAESFKPSVPGSFGDQLTLF